MHNDNYNTKQHVFLSNGSHVDSDLVLTNTHEFVNMKPPTAFTASPKPSCLQPTSIIHAPYMYVNYALYDCII